VTGRYARGVAFLLRHGALALVLFAVMLAAIVVLVRNVPAALAPAETRAT